MSILTTQQTPLSSLDLSGDSAVAYAQGVIAGTIPAARLIRKSCEKFLWELSKQCTPGFQFYYDPSVLDKYIKFCRKLRLTKDKWRGKPMELMPFHCFIMGNTLGWKKLDGRRRFRSSLVFVPRKNAKSMLASSLVLWHTIREGEGGSEAYCVANTKEQAMIVYKEATKSLPPDARKFFKFYTNADRPHAAHQSGGIIRPLSAEVNTLDGLNPSLGVVDELHKMPDAELWNVLEDGMGARSQPLMFGISTAGTARDFGSPARTFWNAIEAGLEDFENWEVHDMFGFIATPNKEDYSAWDQPRVWASCNPGLGICKSLEYMESQVRKAKNLPSQKAAFLCKNLDMWADSDDCWIPSETWKACGYPREEIEKSCKGKVCWAGMDLAQVNDLSSVPWIFPPDDYPKNELDKKWRVLYMAWCPEEDIERRSRDHKVPYMQWVESGQLSATPGPVTDYDQIAEDILGINETYPISAMGYDRAFSGELVQRLEREGITMFPHALSLTALSSPTKQIERLALGGKLAVPSDSLLSWQAANVRLRKDGNANVAVDKRTSREKVDTISALVYAFGCYLHTVGGILDDAGAVAS